MVGRSATHARTPAPGLRCSRRYRPPAGVRRAPAPFRARRASACRKGGAMRTATAQDAGGPARYVGPRPPESSSRMGHTAALRAMAGATAHGHIRKKLGGGGGSSGAGALPPHACARHASKRAPTSASASEASGAPTTTGTAHCALRAASALCHIATPQREQESAGSAALCNAHERMRAPPGMACAIRRPIPPLSRRRARNHHRQRLAGRSKVPTALARRTHNLRSMRRFTGESAGDGAGITSRTLARPAPQTPRHLPPQRTRPRTRSSPAARARALDDAPTRARGNAGEDRCGKQSGVTTRPTSSHGEHTWNFEGKPLPHND